MGSCKADAVFDVGNIFLFFLCFPSFSGTSTATIADVYFFSATITVTSALVSNVNCSNYFLKCSYRIFFNGDVLASLYEPCLYISYTSPFVVLNVSQIYCTLFVVTGACRRHHWYFSLRRCNQVEREYLCHQSAAISALDIIFTQNCCIVQKRSLFFLVFFYRIKIFHNYYYYLLV